MRKVILFLTPLLILTILFLLVILVLNKDSGKGAIQVTSTPESQIFLDNEYVGKTPLCLCELAQLIGARDYDLKLVPTQSGFKTYEQRITIHPGVLTVVDRTFDKESAVSTGSVITLSPIDDEKASELLIVSFPSKSEVILDSNPAGVTPLLLKQVTSSDHEIKVIKEGYKEKIIKVKAIPGKRLEVTLSLGIKTDLNAVEEKSDPAPTTPRVTILDTPTGFLRVRRESSADAVQIETVDPGDKLELVSEVEGWYEIKLEDGKTGWISSSYATKE